MPLTFVSKGRAMGGIGGRTEGKKVKMWEEGDNINHAPLTIDPSPLIPAVCPVSCVWCIHQI